MNISKGKIGYYPLLLKIQKEYKNIGKKTDDSFIDFERNYDVEKFERFLKINNWISNAKDLFIWLELNNNIIGLNEDIINLKNKTLEIENDIELLKMKLLALLKSNDLYKSFLMKLINRYLADFLIRKLLEKYPSDFETIKISPKNFFEIAVNFGEALLKNGNLNELNEKLKLEELI